MVKSKIAEKLGLTFTPAARLQSESMKEMLLHEPAAKFLFFPLSNLMAGYYDGLEINLFDFHFVTRHPQQGKQRPTEKTVVTFDVLHLTPPIFKFVPRLSHVTALTPYRKVSLRPPQLYWYDHVALHRPDYQMGPLVKKLFGGKLLPTAQLIGRNGHLLSDGARLYFHQNRILEPSLDDYVNLIETGRNSLRLLLPSKASLHNQTER